MFAVDPFLAKERRDERFPTEFVLDFVLSFYCTYLASLALDRKFNWLAHEFLSEGIRIVTNNNSPLEIELLLKDTSLKGTEERIALVHNAHILPITAQED